jgi:hypothetical protein
MAKCPKCDKEIAKPFRAFKNSCFHIEAYTCDECFTNFKVNRDIQRQVLGSAFAASPACIPADSEIRNIEMIIAVESVFFISLNYCIILSCLLLSSKNRPFS